MSEKELKEALGKLLSHWLDVSEILKQENNVDFKLWNHFMLPSLRLSSNGIVDLISTSCQVKFLVQWYGLLPDWYKEF